MMIFNVETHLHWSEPNCEQRTNNRLVVILHAIWVRELNMRQQSTMGGNSIIVL